MHYRKRLCRFWRYRQQDAVAVSKGSEIGLGKNIVNKEIAGRLTSRGHYVIPALALN